MVIQEYFWATVLNLLLKIIKLYLHVFSVCFLWGCLLFLIVIGLCHVEGSISKLPEWHPYPSPRITGEFTNQWTLSLCLQEGHKYLFSDVKHTCADSSAECNMEAGWLVMVNHLAEYNWE